MACSKAQWPSLNFRVSCARQTDSLTPRRLLDIMTAETLSQVEVQVYRMSRNNYEWRLVRWGKVIAKGRAASYYEAKEAGEQASRLSNLSSESLGGQTD